MSDTDFYTELKKDVRIQEGLQACMNCGVCTAVCPAAGYYEYDPRSIVITIQSGNNNKIKALLSEDTIWYCGQCMSCKPRCPRNNCPGLIISVLRKLSQKNGLFIKSRLGRQQYLIAQTIGKNILKYGYCVHPTSVNPKTHPEQGPVWQWVYDNMETVYKTTGANLDGEGEGALRKIAEEDLKELTQIFRVSGGTALLQTIDKYSREKASELGMLSNEEETDMDKYTEYIINNENL